MDFNRVKKPKRVRLICGGRYLVNEGIFHFSDNDKVPRDGRDLVLKGAKLKQSFAINFLKEIEADFLFNIFSLVIEKRDHFKNINPAILDFVDPVFKMMKEDTVPFHQRSSRCASKSTFNSYFNNTMTPEEKTFVNKILRFIPYFKVTTYRKALNPIRMIDEAYTHCIALGQCGTIANWMKSLGGGVRISSVSLVKEIVDKRIIFIDP